MTKNTFEIEILDDGRIKVSTTGFDGVIHSKADDFVKAMNEAFGNPVEVTKRKPHLQPVGVANRIKERG